MHYSSQNSVGNFFIWEYMIVIDMDDDDQCVPGLPGEPDDDGDVDDHYDEDDQCLCQGVPGEPDGKLPSQKWCQLARSQN